MQDPAVLVCGAVSLFSTENQVLLCLPAAFIVDTTGVLDIERSLGKHTNTFLATEQFYKVKRKSHFAAFLPVYW